MAKANNNKLKHGKPIKGKPELGVGETVAKPAEPEMPPEYASPACAMHEQASEHGNADGAATWDSVNKWRKQQRKRLLGLREGFSDSQHQTKDLAIMNNLTNSGWLDGCLAIAFYWPMPGEIDLRPLMTGLIEQGATAALPVVTKRNQPLEFWRWTPGERLSEDGLWGIPTPPIRRLVEVDLLLVPMLGFDDDGHRMGFGGGYYDRTIAVMNPAPVCIGVCYESGHMHSIFPQSHDMPMHAIASENQMRIFEQPA
jgi:5,10-methenyltetrahydrofolate synthetase